MANPYQQRVAELLAQTGKRVTDRRLGAPELLGGTADVAFAQQDVEHRQQVRVHRQAINLMHGEDNKSSFFCMLGLA